VKIHQLINSRIIVAYIVFSVIDIDLIACFIYDMFYASIAPQEESECVCEFDSLRFCSESCMDVNSVLSKVSVDSDTRSNMRLDIICN